MIRTQIQLTAQQSKRVKELARRQDITMAEVIRRALDRELQNDYLPAEDEIRTRAIAAIGVFSDTATDVSSRHDEYLAEAIRS